MSKHITDSEAFNNQIVIAKLLKGGLLYQLNYNDAIIDVFMNIANKCKIDNKPISKQEQTDHIFKCFCLFGNMSDCLKYTYYDNKTISDTLFFKQCSDIQITLLAKSLYYVSGTKFQEFLKWQIEIILQYGYINIREEYKKWKISIHGIEELKDIENMIKNIDFD